MTIMMLKYVLNEDHIGLYILNDDLSHAHEIAQSDEGNPTCDYWHSQLHRREGDYWNSKWWIGQFEHPILTKVHGSKLAAKTYVDSIEKAEPKMISELEDVQWREMKETMEYALALEIDR